MNHYWRRYVVMSDFTAIRRIRCGLLLFLCVVCIYSNIDLICSGTCNPASQNAGLHKVFIFGTRRVHKMYRRSHGFFACSNIYGPLWHLQIHSGCKPWPDANTNQHLPTHSRSGYDQSLSLAWQPHSSHIFPKCSSERSVIKHAVRTELLALDFQLFLPDSKRAIAISWQG